MAAGRRGIRRGAGPGSVCKEAGASHSPALRSRTRHEFEDPVGWRRRIERSGRHLELVNWRMCKKKQMGWSRTGAQYLLYVKTAIINGRLDRYTGHHSAPADMAA